MSCLKFAAFYSDYEKYTHFDTIATARASDSISRPSARYKMTLLYCIVLYLTSHKSSKVLCLECLSYLVIAHLNAKVIS